MSAKPKRIPQLDSRLSTALAMAPPFDICADIGADHGQLSAVILLKGLAKKALIADISEKALTKARKCISEHGLEDRAILSVCDGLDALDALSPLHADVIFILGMGGDTMAGILRRGQSRLHNAALILGAHTELPLLRQTLCDIGYRIADEVVTKADRHQYILMKCLPAENQRIEYSERELLLGPILLQATPALWLPILKRRRKFLVQSIEGMTIANIPAYQDRMERFRRELGYVDDAIHATEQKNQYKNAESKEGHHAGQTDL